MDQILQLNEFFVEGGNQAVSHCLLHITEPSTPEEKDKGYFFAVCEINHADTDGIARFQNIISEIENRYYEVEGTPEQSALEIILEKINQENFSLAEGETVFNATIGVIRQTEIIFAFAGKPEALLFYQGKEGHYRKMDLTTENQAETTENTENRPLFPQVIQGKIGPSDYLFVATPHVIDYFSHDRLQKIITTRPARQSAEHLGRVLRELQNTLSFGGLIIHLGKKEEQPAQVIKKNRPTYGSSANSLTNFFSTEKNTASTLSASLWPSVNNKIKQVTEKLTAPTQQRTTTAENRGPVAPAYPSAEINATHVRPHHTSPPEPFNPTAADHLIKIGKVIAQGLLYLGRALIWIGLTLWSLLSGLFRLLAMAFFAATNYQGRRRNILDEWSRNWRSHRENFRSLSLVTKLLLGASLALILVFIGSIFVVRYEKSKALAVKKYQDNIQLVKDNIDAAESALIYKDEASAEKSISAARTGIATLPCKTSEEQTNCQSLNDRLSQTLAKLNKITAVASQKLISWETGGASLTGLVRLKNKFIAFSGSSPSLFIYDLLTKQGSISATNYQTTGFTSAAVPKENNYVALVPTDKQSVAEVNPDDLSVKKVDLTLPSDTTRLDSIVIYNGRLYGLDSSSKQIYRYDPIKTGFAIGRPWLKNGGSLLEGTSDLTIDGDIFALKTSGGIIKLTAGSEATFDEQKIDPPLGRNAKIFTYTDAIYLYILDQENKRLIIYDKTGLLKAQIPLTDFTKPADIFVDETNKIAYILDQGSLFSLPLPI